MSNPDPYRSDEPYYECVECHGRTAGVAHLGRCPDCGGTVRNLAVARE
ncbi:MAG: rubrerythrin-like domain-containing protein [Halalkalicoccus sp.]